jgi:hypothetical protein
MGVRDYEIFPVTFGATKRNGRVTKMLESRSEKGKEWGKGEG